MKTVAITVACGGFAFLVMLSLQKGYDYPHNSVPEESQTEELESSFPEDLRLALRGRPVKQAAEFKPEREYHPTVVFMDSGKLHSWQEYLPTDWRAWSVGETELVLLVSKQKETLVGQRNYVNGPPIRRYMYEVDVRLIGAKNGRLIAQKRFVSMPREARRREPRPVTRLGEPVRFATVLDWVEASLPKS